jgi:hypothetical protein
VGTSTSYRSPAVPRWQAFVGALENRLPIPRIRSELFNAGSEWEEALGSPGVAAYAATISQAHDHLESALRSDASVADVLADLADDARRASSVEQSSAAEAVAERALLALLIRTLSGGEQSLSELGSEAAADRWRAARPETAEAFLSDFIGEVLAQYARHAVARESGRLALGPARLGASESRELTRLLASEAYAVGVAISPTDAAPERLRRDWADLVAKAFAAGRRLPRDGDD